MKLGEVIGRVTFSKTVPSLRGGRFLVVSPFTRAHFPTHESATPKLSRDPSPIVYDDLGGGLGQIIGYVEGREAAMPFVGPTPVDALNTALVDAIFYTPMQ
jgi:ethanolamine utilization protein EutN